MKVIVPGEDIDLVGMLRKTVTPRERRAAAIRAACAYYDVTEAQLKNRSKRAEFVRARDAAVWIMHAKLQMSASAIGRYLERDHTTILASLTRTRKDMSAGVLTMHAVAALYDAEVNVL